MYARNLFKAVAPDGFFLGSIPLTILLIIVSGLLGWYGPCFGCKMLAISRKALYSPTMLFRLPLIIILSQFTIDTLFPCSNKISSIYYNRSAFHFNYFFLFASQ